MKIAQESKFQQSFDIKRLALYNEAMDLFTLSRKLSNGNLQHSVLNCPSEKELATNLSVFISHTALSLPMSIAEAAITADYSKKLYFQKHIEERVSQLSKLCKKLEVLYRNRCHSVQQLAHTAHKLEAGFKKWSLQLTSQN
ncbi:hypothetical protein DCS32_12170 [Dokdonia sp. Dokd-P16]|uniref:hypothetical protein n=1 Tax=Dokdonia sp. Dokd-P16 TaxID=2173169 RepID=UPI000D545382|nr:hypothetical protein [Dokdonia sp. Dokd-P16]AWH74889.1 hypothetical protein DCS32_12170 [Dokdonia sp. Dokd-P16]